MKFKKVMCAILCLGCLCGCATPQASVNPKADQIQVVATIFPEYDWIRKLIQGSDSIDLSLLMTNGSDLHSYQPSAADLVKVSSADVFVYVGGASDLWIEDALKNATNPTMKSINLMSVLSSSIKEEEWKEGMMEEEASDEVEYDEHVWLSLRNASTCVEAIAEVLSQVDPANAELYQTNLKSYQEKLNKLDMEYQQVVDASDTKTLLFGDRFPFRYLVDDYGLDYAAAFVGCSSESEASFETIAFLAKKVDELGLRHVLTIDHSDDKIARTIISATQTKDQDILELDSLQSTSLKDAQSGKTYLGAMEENRNVLENALSLK